MFGLHEFHLSQGSVQPNYKTTCGTLVLDARVLGFLPPTQHQTVTCAAHRIGRTVFENGDYFFKRN